MPPGLPRHVGKQGVVDRGDRRVASDGHSDVRGDTSSAAQRPGWAAVFVLEVQRLALPHDAKDLIDASETMIEAAARAAQLGCSANALAASGRGADRRPGRRFAARNSRGFGRIFRLRPSQGRLPALKGHRAQFTAPQRRISLSWNLIALSGDIGLCQALRGTAVAGGQMAARGRPFLRGEPFLRAASPDKAPCGLRASAVAPCQALPSGRACAGSARVRRRVLLRPKF